MGFEDMSLLCYSVWYKTDVAPNLTREQKIKLLKRISDVSLERPITVAGQKFDKKDFPELAKYMHTKDLTGLQLYAVMKELFKEQYPNVKLEEVV